MRCEIANASMRAAVEEERFLLIYFSQLMFVYNNVVF